MLRNLIDLVFDEIKQKKPCQSQAKWRRHCVSLVCVWLEVDEFMCKDKENQRAHSRNHNKVNWNYSWKTYFKKFCFGKI